MGNCIKSEISHGLLTTGYLEENEKYYCTIDDFSVKIDESKFQMYVTINDISEENP